MKLTKYKLGELIELLGNANADLQYGVDDVRGVNNLKKMMPTKADLNGRNLTKFQIVYPGEFFFNHRTSRNGSKFSITYNYEKKPIICTEDYVVFKVKNDCENTLSKEWLYMYFNRAEFDRFVITNSWGSSTEFYNWSDICDIELDLPSLDIQQKYVDIYNAMVSNQQCYERGLEDLKLTCDAYIEDLRRKTSCKPIAEYLLETKQKNENAELLPNRSVSNTKIFIDAKEAVVSGVDTKNYLIVEQNDFAYNTVTTRNADKLSIALNTEGRCLVSPLYTTFRVVKEGLLPEYLCLWFNRSEYDRYARFESWGSARELYSFDTLAETQIPIPDIAIQQSIVNIYKSYSERRTINERLKAQIKDICPILIKGSIEEARKEA